MLLPDGTTAAARWVLSGADLPGDAGAETGVVYDSGGVFAGAGFATFADAAAWARRRLGVSGWALADDGGWVPATGLSASEACDRETLKADALEIVGPCPHPRVGNLGMCRYHFAEAVAKVLPVPADASVGLDSGGCLDGSVSVDAQWLASAVGVEVGAPSPNNTPPCPAALPGSAADTNRRTSREPRVPPPFTGGGTWDDDSVPPAPEAGYPTRADEARGPWRYR